MAWLLLLPWLLSLLLPSFLALQCYSCRGVTHTWTLKEREALSTKFERGERFQRVTAGRDQCLKTGGDTKECPQGARYCTLTVRVGTQNYMFTPGHGDMMELQVTDRDCAAGAPGPEYIGRFPPPGTGLSLQSDWGTRYQVFPEGMKCKLIHKEEEETLHCVCEGDLCNEDLIPGTGANFFNYSATITFVCCSVLAVICCAVCVVCSKVCRMRA